MKSKKLKEQIVRVEEGGEYVSVPAEGITYEQKLDCDIGNRKIVFNIKIDYDVE